MVKWLEWYLACNYDSYKRQLKVLPEESIGRIIKLEWPGVDYNEKLKIWRKAVSEHETSKNTSKAQGGGNCNIQ